jgi:3-methylfumaryl-CoA hydratase
VSFADVAASWRPPAREDVEVLDPRPAAALAALLDQPTDDLIEGVAVPPMWTALYFLERPAQRELGEDGHPRDGAFLPPIPNRRRMFAGGRLEVTAPLLLGEEATRRSEVTGVTPKTGRSGELLFVTVRQTYAVRGETRIVEEQDLVYRSAEPVTAATAAPRWDTPPPVEHDARWSLRVTPDPVMLFRFSALTYNAHRIHYDLPYATGVEGLGGLLVHGPLLSVLALELPRRHAREHLLRRLRYRARRPVLCGQPLVVTAQPAGSGTAELALAVNSGGPEPAFAADVQLEQEAG